MQLQTWGLSSALCPGSVPRPPPSIWGLELPPSYSKACSCASWAVLHRYAPWRKCAHIWTSAPCPPRKQLGYVPQPHVQSRRAVVRAREAGRRGGGPAQLHPYSSVSGNLAASEPLAKGAWLLSAGTQGPSATCLRHPNLHPTCSRWRFGLFAPAAHVVYCDSWFPGTDGLRRYCTLFSHLRVSRLPSARSWERWYSDFTNK